VNKGIIDLGQVYFTPMSSTAKYRFKSMSIQLPLFFSFYFFFFHGPGLFGSVLLCQVDLSTSEGGFKKHADMGGGKRGTEAGHGALPP